MERYWVEAVFFISLGQDRSQCEIGGVGFNDHRFGWVEVGQNGGCAETLLELFKSCLRLRVPAPFLLFALFGQLRQGPRYPGVVLDELSIEVSEPQKGLYFR